MYMRAPGLIVLNQVEVLEIESHIFYTILDYPILGIIWDIKPNYSYTYTKVTYNLHKGPRPNSAVLLKVLVVESHILCAILDSSYNYVSISNLWTQAMPIKALDLKLLSCGGGIDD